MSVSVELNEERLRTQRQITRRYRLDNEQMEGALLDANLLSDAFSQIADSLSSVIMSSNLTRQEKEDFLKNLSQIPIVIGDVTQAQTSKKRPASEETSTRRRPG